MIPRMTATRLISSEMAWKNSSTKPDSRMNRAGQMMRPPALAENLAGPDALDHPGDHAPDHDYRERQEKKTWPITSIQLRPRGGSMLDRMSMRMCSLRCKGVG